MRFFNGENWLLIIAIIFILFAMGDDECGCDCKCAKHGCDC